MGVITLFLSKYRTNLLLTTILRFITLQTQFGGDWMGLLYFCLVSILERHIVLDAQTQNGDEPVGEYSYPGVKLPF